jgi:glycosyltransferase involved in cell wall biosynthesis
VYGKTGNKKVIIYQGALNIGRGIENVISAMKYLDDAIFLIVGKGDITEKLMKIAENESVSDRVVFIGRVPIEELYFYTKCAHLGISLEENLGLNYYYALPNKIFDYIQAGVPVLVSDFPEMRKIVEEHKVGYCTLERDAKKLAIIISEILANEEEYTKLKERVKVAAQQLNWETEEKKLMEVFEKVY